MQISVIIPTYNEATTIRAAAAALGEAGELIVVDGGSGDETVAIARAEGMRVLEAARGRGRQMNAGARAASGDVLLFLHADTRLPAGAFAAIEALLADPRVCGGHFSLVFDGGTWESRALTRLYPVLRWFGMCYGDSGIFLRREAFARLGEYQDYPLFEDCDLFRRARRLGRFERLPLRARTSSRRFEGRFLRTFALWSLLQCLYWLGVSPARLDRLYRPLR